LCTTAADFAARAGIPGGGAIRASVGLASNVADVDRFLAVVETTYRGVR
jgi:selenocysteine lyase/cysteine desulfurase